jgi:hypothetical protein
VRHQALTRYSGHLNAAVAFLRKALRKIDESGKVSLDLRIRSKNFIEMLDDYGRFRYFEVSHRAFGADLITLDRAVWELRRHCTCAEWPKTQELRHGFAAPLVIIPGGCLEKIIDNPNDHARKPLLWQNAFFGKRTRKGVRICKWMKAHNAPLYLNPQILDEVLKYVYIPKDMEDGYRGHTKQ